MKTQALDAAVVLVAAALLLVLAFGGIDIRIGPVDIRVHDWARPAILLVVVLIARRFIARFPTGYVAARALQALLLAIVVAYLQHHVRFAGGLDSYGYVSSASLLASGRLTEAQSLAHLLPFDRAAQTTVSTPLGYVPAREGYASVPRFPLGLPLVMALFEFFGPTGPFFVPLLAGFGVLALAYVLAREPGDQVPGLFAAVVVAADPLMFHYTLQPMSDVPAVFWMLAALWLRLAYSRAGLAAGLCGGMAMLTRPALLPAVLVLGAVTTSRQSLRPTAIFAATVTIFIGIQMALNHVLYGSAALSGYGTASHMFEMSGARISANARNYGKWLTYSHSAVVWVLWPASLIALRKERWAWQVSAVAAAAALPYLFYLVFDDWESSRFLLLTIVLVAILFARTSRFVLRRASPDLAFALLAFLFCLSSHLFLAREGVYQFGSVESKYALVGEWFKSHTSSRAVVLAGLHSGSIRMYGNRETLRWDEVPAEGLRAMVRTLQAEGFELYLALDNPSEPSRFETRFHANPSDLAEPIARVRVVDIYQFLSAR